MQVKYGGYGFPLNGASWLYGETRVERNAVGYALAARVVVTGTIFGTSTTDLNNQITAMRIAARTPGLDVQLVSDAGVVLEYLRAAGALVAPRCVAGPSFGGQRPSEYVTLRDFTATFEAVYPTSSQIITIAATKSLQFAGGHAIVVFLNDVNGGPPQKQQTVPRTTFTCVQAGTIVTRNGAGLDPGPIFNTNLLVANPETLLTQSLTETGWEYSRSWVYRYESQNSIA